LSLVNFRCKTCRTMLDEAYSEPNHTSNANFYMKQWYVDDRGSIHTLIVCLHCGTFHDCTASILGFIPAMLGLTSAFDVEKWYTSDEMGTKITNVSHVDNLTYGEMFNKYNIDIILEKLLFERGLILQEVPSISNIHADYCIKIGQYTKAYIVFLKNATTGSGDAVAQYKLSLMLLNGQGVLQNYQDAFQFMLLSAEQGFIEAQYKTGQLYLEGIGVCKDYSNAIKWLSLAKSQGHLKSHEMLNMLNAL
jgi:Sel1 repeat